MASAILVPPQFEGRGKVSDTASRRTAHKPCEIDRPGSVRAHVGSSEFLDIGTPDDYLRTSLLLSQREGTGAAHGAGTRVDATARVEDSVLWDDVDVGPGSMLKQCIVTDGARVPSETSWIGVTLRRADSQLAPGECRIGDLCVASF